MLYAVWFVCLFVCSPAILSKLQRILADYQSLLQKAETQRKRLQEQFQLYQFERDFQLVDAWLSSKQSIAESDDYGQDLDGVEVKENKRCCMCYVVKQKNICQNFCAAFESKTLQWQKLGKPVLTAAKTQTGYCLLMVTVCFQW